MLVIFVSTASAGIIGTIDIDSVTYELTDPANLYGGGFTGQSVNSGIYSFVTSDPTGAGVEVVDYGFCIQLNQTTVFGQSYDVRDLEDAPLPADPLYPASTPMGAAKAEMISKLWGNFFNPAWLAGGTPNKQLGEAFGIAIWEIVWETSGTLDVTSGSFYADNVEQAVQANIWLGQLAGITTNLVDVVALSNNGSQDFVTVPEPATMALLSLGAFVLRRKRK